MPQSPIPSNTTPVRTYLLVALGCVVLLAAFIKWGRPIWKPIHIKLTGKRRVADIKRLYTKRVKSQYEMLRKQKPKRHKPLPSWRDLINGKRITLLAFKKERRLELWKQIGARPRFVKAYRFTGFSGGMGPKRKSGDGQIPEGVYQISYLNPNSSYHLSMKVSYPNRFDRAMGKKDKRRKLGGDIFIHGKNVTIGCIPIGDRAIEELFTIIAHNGSSHTKVIIAPHDFRKHKALPKLEGISWAPELYRRIKHALKAYR